MNRPLALHQRLLIHSLAILLLGMTLAGLLTWRAVEQMYLDTQRKNLLAQASLMAAALVGQPLPIESTQPYTQTSNIQPGIHTRIFSDQGVMLYNLPLAKDLLAVPAAEQSAPIAPEELLARTEVNAAMSGQPSSAVRSVAGRRVLYAAAAVTDMNGAPSGLVYLAVPLPASGLPGRLALEFAGAALAAILAALAAGTWLARRLSAPVEAVAAAAREVSTGNLNKQVPNDSEILEINLLSQAFNSMTGSLRQAEQTRNAFIADVTHELRTPLTVIKGTIETLEDGALDDLTGRGPLLKSMQRETERLIRLVNDLLLLSRADAGTLALDLQAIDLAAVAQERCQHFTLLAGRSQVQLEVTGPQTACIFADGDRLSQVLDNLLDNAIRFSPPGELVTLEITSRDGKCCATVHDRGPGIAEEHLPRIFDRFYRADPSRDRRTGGAGLGLAIVKTLVLAMGGSVSVRSKPAEGAHMSICFPEYANCPSVD